MTYLDFINKLRVELKDFKKIHREKWDGDASTTVFEATHIPIADGTYTVKIGATTKTDGTDYSLDRDTGLITFATAPAAGSDNIEMTYKATKIRDEDWVEIINDGIDSFAWKLWEMDVDITTLTTVKDQYEYDCSGITDILYVLRVWFKSPASSTTWQDVQSSTNWRYYTRLQKLYTDPPFDNSSLPMKILYLKSITKGTLTSDTLNIPTKWLLPFKYYAYARFYERLIPEKISETGAVTTLPSFAPSQVVYDISQKYYLLAEKVATRLAPKLPAMPIKQLSGGIAI